MLAGLGVSTIVGGVESAASMDRRSSLSGPTPDGREPDRGAERLERRILLLGITHSEKSATRPRERMGPPSGTFTLKGEHRRVVVARQSARDGGAVLASQPREVAALR